MFLGSRAFSRDRTVSLGVTFDIRIVDLDGNPWFVAADVCRALGFDPTSGTTKRHLRMLGETEHRNVQRSNVNPGDVSFPNRGATLISESGLYKLILRSDKPQARAFQDWVTRDVLPTIRKTGSYVMGTAAAPPWPVTPRNETHAPGGSRGSLRTAGVHGLPRSFNRLESALVPPRVR